jgi:hypothetical protein
LIQTAHADLLQPGEYGGEVPSLGFKVFFSTFKTSYFALLTQMIRF